jgi:hypothetical protein
MWENQQINIMRRNYISPEFVKSKIYGSYSSLEESNFYGSKMLEIEDTIDITNQNIIYHQNFNNEQIDVNVETSQNSVIYSSFDDKNTNHTLTIDESQKDSQLKTNTRWFLDIDLKTILTDFVFANVKRQRTFQGLTNNMVTSRDVNVFIKNYITKNVLDRYKLTSIDLFVSYMDIRNENNLQYTNTFDRRVGIESYRLVRFETNTFYDYSKTRITFNQERSSQDWAFGYYFNLNFVKI